MSKQIVLVAGPSGAGKDTLLNFSRKIFKGNNQINFLKRCITREPDGNEDNTFLTEDQFSEYVKDNLFLIHWEAHGNRYGILDRDLIDGVNIISVSRTVIKDICQNVDNVAIVEVTADKDVLRQRLISRGRETNEQVDRRLDRDVPIDIESKKVIDNSYDISLAVNRFVNFINELYRSPVV